MSLVRIRVPMARPLMRCNFKRLVRTMPSILLLLFVFTLIFVTLMQIAIIHSNRRSHYTSSSGTHRSEPLNSTTNLQGTHPLPQVYSSSSSSSTQNGGGGGVSKNSQPTKTLHHGRMALKVEAYLDKAAPTVENNVIMLQNLANAVRIKHLLHSMKSIAESCAYLPPPPSSGGYEENHHHHVETVWNDSAVHQQHHSMIHSAGQKDSLRTTVVQRECVLRTDTGNTVQDDELRRKRTCPPVPHLVGRLKVNLASRNLSDLEDLLRRSPYMRGRGSWTPRNCTPNHRVAIIIPYRDRMEHLATLLYTLHPLLQRQLIEYRVFVVEQYGNDTFNKGVLMNAGVKEALRSGDFQCLVFHDVDMIPEDDRNMYTCPPMPRHMSVAVDKFNYTLPYNLLVGGVFALKLEHYFDANGYSNLYWGWGGEDDDMAYRIKYKKLEIIRPPEALARYTMIKHNHRAESPNAIRRALLRMAKKRASKDGLSTAKYRVVWRKDLMPYTHLMIDIGHYHRWQFENTDSGQKLIINF